MIVIGIYGLEERRARIFGKSYMNRVNLSLGWWGNGNGRRGAKGLILLDIGVMKG